MGLGCCSSATRPSRTATRARGTLGGEIGRADVVIAAAGQAGLVRGGWIAPGAVAIVTSAPTAGPTASSAATSGVRRRAREKRARAITPVVLDSS